MVEDVAGEEAEAEVLVVQVAEGVPPGWPAPRGAPRAGSASVLGHMRVANAAAAEAAAAGRVPAHRVKPVGRSATPRGRDRPAPVGVAMASRDRGGVVALCGTRGRAYAQAEAGAGAVTMGEARKALLAAERAALQ